MTTAQENSVEQVPAWKKAGLPGWPAATGEKWRLLLSEEYFPVILRGPDDKAIICTEERILTAKMLSKRYNRKIETIRFIADEDVIRSLKQNKADFFAVNHGGYEYGLLVTEGKPLTLPEREGAAALAWYLENHIPGIARREKYILPAVFRELHQDDIPAHIPLLWKAFTERKAYQMAEAVKCLADVEAFVFEDGGGFFVGINQCGKVEDWSLFEQLEMTFFLLQEFDLVAGDEKEMQFTDASTYEEQGEQRLELGRKADHLVRIDRKLDQLLAAQAAPALLHAKRIEETKAAIEGIPTGKRFKLQIGGDWREMVRLIEWKGDAGEFEDAAGGSILIPLNNVTAVCSPENRDTFPDDWGVKKPAADVKAKPRAPAKSAPKSSKRSA